MSITRHYFYYLRGVSTSEEHPEHRGSPIVTVCLGFDDEEVAYRGVSICSKKENPVKVKGKHIAYGRMIKAHNTGFSGDNIDRDESYESLKYVTEIMSSETKDVFLIDNNMLLTFGYKSDADAYLSKYEEKLKNLKGR